MQAEPGFADARRADQRQQPQVPVEQARADLFHVGIAAQQLGQRRERAGVWVRWRGVWARGPGAYLRAQRR